MNERDRTERGGSDQPFEDADPTEWLGTARPEPQQSWQEEPTEYVQRRPRSRPWSRLKRSRSGDPSGEASGDAAHGAGDEDGARSAADGAEATQASLSGFFATDDAAGDDEEPTTYLDPSAPPPAGSTLLQPPVDPGEYEPQYEPTRYQQPAPDATQYEQPQYEQSQYQPPEYGEREYEPVRYEQPHQEQPPHPHHGQAGPPAGEAVWPGPDAPDHSTAPPDLPGPSVAAEEPDAVEPTTFVRRLAASGDPSSRSEILGRIRAAVGGRPAPTWEVRGYRRSLELRHDDLIALFSERVRDYQAEIRRIGAEQLAAEIAVRLVERGIRRVVVPADAPPSWLPQYVDVQIDDGELTAADIDGIDGVITGSAVAIAETGTIVLDGGRLQGRRMLSLVPDYHLCVVEASDVVGNLPEALARLDPTRPLTFVSGPSATSDIELDRVEGVHGPRTLDILLID